MYLDFSACLWGGAYTCGGKTDFFNDILLPITKQIPCEVKLD